MVEIGPHGVRYEAHRPVIMGRKGMVCAGHPLASEAGLSILRRGGNAVDAAIAAGAALGVVQPYYSGIGGDGYLMIYRSDMSPSGTPADQISIVNATGPAPLRATMEAYAGGIPMKGIRSASVPGLLDGWLQAHDRFGKLPLAECFGPAIALADDGFPISHHFAREIAADPSAMEFPSSRAVFGPQGYPLRPGEIIIQRELAHSLRLIAAEGRGAFYEGPIARAIVSVSDRDGGLLSLKDFAGFHAEWQRPISTRYRGHDVYELPPNSSGFVLLEELNLVEGFDLAAMGANSADAVHVMVEAKRLAFADREHYLADPIWTDIPLDGLISKDYARQRARLIDPQRALRNVDAGDPWPYSAHSRVVVPGRGRFGGSEDTTCLAVVDGDGNAVCQIQSVQSSMGSGLIVDGTGILLNNRMTYWHTDPSHVDHLEPGKRVRHTMNTVMVFHDDQLVLVHGTPGGDTQVQTNLQVLTNIVDHGMTVVEAIEAPRWRHIGVGTESTIPYGESDALNLESRFPDTVREELAAMGHPVVCIGAWEGAGSEVAIQIDPSTGALFGACDPRDDGYAMGF